MITGLATFYTRIEEGGFRALPPYPSMLMPLLPYYSNGQPIGAEVDSPAPAPAPTADSGLSSPYLSQVTFHLRLLIFMAYYFIAQMRAIRI